MKMRNSMRISSVSGAFRWLRCLCIVAFVAALTGCRVERPKNVISPTKLEDVLYDYHLAQVMASDLNGDEVYKRALYMEYVYDKHHITRAQLDSSLVWYARNPNELSRIYERLQARADREMEYIKARQALSELRGPHPVEGDSADLWYDNRLLVLTAAPLDNRRIFTVPSDSNFHLCDTIEWLFDALFIPSDTVPRYAVASLLLRYNNDSLLARDVVMRTDTAVRIVLQNTDSVKMKEVKASVYFSSPHADDHVLISHNRLMRYHHIVPVPPADSLSVDSLSADSLSTDSLSTDSLSTDSLSTSAGKRSSKLFAKRRSSKSSASRSSKSSAKNRSSKSSARNRTSKSSTESLSGESSASGDSKPGRKADARQSNRRAKDKLIQDTLQ